MSESGQRLDKWLWFARFFKSRSLATKVCARARLRVNSIPVGKAHHPVKVGDVLTFPLGPHVRVIRILDLGVRRGPATEARRLYEDLAPPNPPALAPTPTTARRDPGSGRPTKADRRATERLRGRD